MEVFKLEGTSYTPEVVFDWENKIFEIIGDSRPENTHEFYQKLIDQLMALKEYKETAPIRFKFAFDYLNSSSSKFVLKLIFCLKELIDNGINFIIDWHYDVPDIDMKELGEEYSEMAEIDINLISVEI